MNCLIAGASGLTGQNLLSMLLDDPKVISVNALVRSDLPIAHTKLHTIISSFDQLDRLVLPHADVAFCCLGTTIKKAGSQDAFFKVDHDYIINFSKACHRSGINTFIVISSLGADSNSKIFYNQVKGQTETDLIKVNFKQLYILRPSLLLGDRLESRPLEKLAQYASHIFGTLMVGPLKIIRPVSVKAVAKKMKALALVDNQTNEGVRIIGNEEIL
jgi:uncharacterized protein YbjT (DUF2867 family)